MLRPKNPAARAFIGLIAAGLLLAYCIYGLMHVGIYWPGKHGSAGILATGPAAWVATAGVVLMVARCWYYLFMAKPFATEKESPFLMRWLGVIALFIIIGGMFLPTVKPVSQPPYFHK